ncbi:phosphate signaling complex protein PhoU [Hydrogenophaga soli]|nr:phosphate signaling complex protein PhoU [Burkholderiaceae bacterium]
MGDKHISSQFDAELNNISAKVMEMGGLVESQLRHAIYAFAEFSAEVADQVVEREALVNQLEVDIDHDVSSTIGRRQPTARDLRMLLAMSKITANLERAGDEVSRMARMVKLIIESGSARALPSSDLHVAADLASDLLRRSLDAFARLDTETALAIIKADDQLDHEYDGFLRKLMTYIMEDPRTISASLNLLFLAKAIERVGDHAKNIAESTIYVAKGTDVRHMAPNAMDTVVQ